MTYGLLIVSTGWIFLAARYHRGRHSIDAWFLRFYIVGALIILLDNFHGVNLLSAVSLVNFLAPIYLLWRNGK